MAEREGTYLFMEGVNDTIYRVKIDMTHIGSTVPKTNSSNLLFLSVISVGADCVRAKVMLFVGRPSPAHVCFLKGLEKSELYQKKRLILFSFSFFKASKELLSRYNTVQLVHYPVIIVYVMFGRYNALCFVVVVNKKNTKI